MQEQVQFQLGKLDYDDPNPDWLDSERARDANFSVEGQPFHGPFMFVAHVLGQAQNLIESKAETKQKKKGFEEFLREQAVGPGVGSVDASDDVEIPHIDQVSIANMTYKTPGYPLDCPVPCRYERGCMGGVVIPGELNTCLIGSGCSRYVRTSIKNLKPHRNINRDSCGTPVFDLMRMFTDQRPFVGPNDRNAYDANGVLDPAKLEMKGKTLSDYFDFDRAQMIREFIPHKQSAWWFIPLRASTQHNIRPVSYTHLTLPTNREV